MQHLVTFSEKFLTLYLLNIGFYYGIKRTRYYYGRLKRTLCADDLFYLMILTFVQCALLLPGSSWAHAIGYGITITLFMLLWVDAILMSQYTLELNWHAFKIFITGTNLLNSESKSLFNFLMANLWVPLWIPMMFLAYATVLFIPNSPFTSYVLPCVIAYLLLVGTKSNLNVKKLPLWIAIAGATYALWNFYKAFETIPHIPTETFLMFVFMFVVASKVFHKKLPGHFFNAHSALANLFINTTLKNDEKIKIKKHHETLLIEPPQQQQKKSNQFGAFKGANIIVITLESVGSEYLEMCEKSGAHTPFLESLIPNALFSNRHFCISPNTNSAYECIFSGNYPGIRSWPHLALLHEHGYTSVFAKPDDCDAFNFKDMLIDIGFNTRINSKKTSEKRECNDYTLINAVPEIIEHLGDSPFFLQLLTTQTHCPYTTINKEKFNRHKKSSPLANYLNTVEEADHIIECFMNELGKHIDLSNTFLLVTGDHGQAFGQYGYKTHSNATINHELLVPFILHHPQLHPQNIAHSSHFDIFPTLFDCLGIEYNYATAGRTMFSPRTEYDYLFYSITRKGRLPSNFSVLTDDYKYMIDLVFSRFYKLTHNDEYIGELRGEEKSYIQQLLYRSLEKRGLITNENSLTHL